MFHVYNIVFLQHHISEYTTAGSPLKIWFQSITIQLIPFTHFVPLPLSGNHYAVLCICVCFCVNGVLYVFHI